MRAIGRLVWVIISAAMVLLAIDFAVSNDSIIRLALWPFTDSLDLPLWLLGVAAFISGGVLGALIMWGHALAIRAKLWHAQSQNRKLQWQLAQPSYAEDHKNTAALQHNSK